MKEKGSDGGGGFRLDQGGQWGSLAVKAAWVSKRGVTQPGAFPSTYLSAYPGLAQLGLTQLKSSTQAVHFHPVSTGHRDTGRTSESRGVRGWGWELAHR